jgi:hypothetical protein
MSAKTAIHTMAYDIVQSYPVPSVSINRERERERAPEGLETLNTPPWDIPAHFDRNGKVVR